MLHTRYYWHFAPICIVFADIEVQLTLDTVTPVGRRRMCDYSEGVIISRVHFSDLPYTSSHKKEGMHARNKVVYYHSFLQLEIIGNFALLFCFLFLPHTLPFYLEQSTVNTVLYIICFTPLPYSSKGLETFICCH